MYLRYEVEVGDKGTLEDDGDVGRVEQLDGVGAVLATVACTLDGQIDSESLHMVNVYSHPVSHTSTCMCVCMYVCVCMYMCVCVCVCTHVCTYICIYHSMYMYISRTVCMFTDTHRQAEHEKSEVYLKIDDHTKY